MRFTTPTSLLLALVLSLTADSGHAWQRSRTLGVPRAKQSRSDVQLRDGDNPLTTFRSFSGHVDVVLDVALAADNRFEVAGIPEGATIVGAWSYVTYFLPEHVPPIYFAFDGNDLTTQGTLIEDEDEVLNCITYRFDVTPYVTGNGPYPVQRFLPASAQGLGDALVVVYEHESLPSRHIVLNDGSEGLEFASSSTSFELRPGPTELILFVQADDFTGTEESVRWNGELVDGPGNIFDQNVGFAASVLRYVVEATSGPNDLTITTDTDWIGYHIAIARSRPDAVCAGVRLDFESSESMALVNGQDIRPGEEFGSLVEISGVSSSGNRAAIFDSDPEGPNAFSTDPDLLVGLGNVLILQENPTQTTPGIYDAPDDDAHGGSLLFRFPRSVRLSSIDLIDVCPGPGQPVWVVLRNLGGASRVYHAPTGWTRDVWLDGGPGFGTLDLTTLADQPGFQSTATAVESDSFRADEVIEMEVFLAGSGAVDNVCFDAPTTQNAVDVEGLELLPGQSLDPDEAVGSPSSGVPFSPTSLLQRPSSPANVARPERATKRRSSSLR